LNVRGADADDVLADDVGDAVAVVARAVVVRSGTVENRSSQRIDKLGVSITTAVGPVR